MTRDTLNVEMGPRRRDEGLGRATLPPSIEREPPLSGPSSPHVMTPREAASYLRVSPAWIKRRIAEGMPYTKISSRKIRIVGPEMLAWLRDRQTKQNK